MLVTTYRDGRARTGLLIGEANVRRYFKKHRPSIELRLDDLHIQCVLEPEFWQGRPEIHDPRLSTWLEFKAGRRADSQPMQLELAPSGAGKFTVRPHAAQRYQAFGADVIAPKRETRVSLGPVVLVTRSVA